MRTSVDDTLIRAWAGDKSFVRRDGDDQDDHRGRVGDFKRSERSNETPQSKTDPDARQALGGLPRAKLISREGHLSPSTYVNSGLRCCARVVPGAIHQQSCLLSVLASP